MSCYIILYDVMFANPPPMAFRITYWYLVSLLIHVMVYETINGAGSVYMRGNLSNTNSLPVNCWFFYESYATCDLSNTNGNDPENATQVEIETVLSWAGVNLTELFIYDTIILNIPVSVCRLKQLQSLYLHYNRISTLRPTDCFTGMNQLDTLYLADNQISDLPVGFFKDLRNLRYLYLHMNEISVLPEGIFDNLQSLSVLCLSENLISVLPEGIFEDLTSLETLMLDFNNISQASGIRANFSLMGSLNLSSNQISELPDGCFNNVQQLRSLDLSYNRISILPEGIFNNLYQLAYLFLNNNVISDISGISAHLSPLQYLEMSGNQTMDLPDRAFSYLQQLLHLDLSYNRISILRKGCFDNLPRLEYLYLNNNEISDPSGISANLTTLKYLDMSRNQIVDLPDRAFSYLQHLRYLILSYNRISVLRYGIFDNLTQLFSLDLNNNEISDLTGISANLSQLTYLDLSRNQISDLPDRVFSYSNQLLHLNLSYNFIACISEEIFDNLDQLIDLRLNNNNISNPVTFQGYLPKMESLDISSNRISVLSPLFLWGLGELNWLNLRNNTITELSGVCFTSFSLKLRYLDLSGNNISSLPANCFSSYQNLEFIDLSSSRLLKLTLAGIVLMLDLKHFNVSHNALESVDFSFDLNNIISNYILQQRLIDFSYNQISSVDTWWQVLAKFCYSCTFNLSHNRITHGTSFYTNTLDTDLHEDSKSHSIVIDLKKNPVRHIIDMIKGWNFRKLSQFWDFLKNSKMQPFVISMDSLVCDCEDFAVKQDYNNKLNNFNLDLTQAICSAPTNLRNTSLSAISIDEMLCHVEGDCPYNCSCDKQPSKNSMIINCTDGGLTDMPTTLPSLNHLPGYKYYLVLSKSRINRLNYKDYISGAKQLDISSSGVNEIDPRMWTALQTVSNVSLATNLLTQFPEVPHGWFTGVKLDIQNNPISCDCKNKWLKSWLESIDEKILNPISINCNSPEWLKGKSVILLQEEDFCSDPPYTLKDYLLVTIPTIGGILLLSVIVVLLLRTFRFKIFKYTKIHLFDRDECVGEDIDYDVFLSRSSKDEEFAEELIALLEREGYTLCYPDRDFMPGSIINDNIFQSIYKSKRVLCLVTTDFVQSNYCMEEFRIARLRDLEMGKRRTTLLLKEPVQHFRDNEQVPNDVRDYIRRHTCIEKQNVDWEDQLMYAMPERRMLNMDETRHEVATELTDGEPTFEFTQPDGDDLIDQLRLLNCELR